MASKKKSLRGSGIYLLLAVGSLIALIVFLLSRSTSRIPKLIYNKLVEAGYSSDFAMYWIAISKFETANYTSFLFKRARNLFGMGYPTIGKDYGSIQSKEGLKSLYPSWSASIDDLVEYLNGFHYPKTFDSIESLTSFMKSKGYFEADLQTYTAGVKKYLPFVGGGGKFDGHGASGSW